MIKYTLQSRSRLFHNVKINHNRRNRDYVAYRSQNEITLDRSIKFKLYRDYYSL